MKKTVTSLGLALGAFGLSASLAAPLAAQEIETAEIEGELTIDPATPDKGVDEAAMLAMMSQLFQVEPLTAEQETRLPAATAVVATMLPDGFYGEMMSGIMEKTMRPMMAMFANPDMILASRLALEDDAMAELSEAEKKELATLLDPAWEQRADAIVEVLVANMGDAFAAVEPPVRSGLAKAYAVRFDEAQLADIATFFATPTGGEFARESMALFADPQVLGATMQALPQMIGTFTNLETAMLDAMKTLPAERDYADLSSAQRQRMGTLLGVEQDALSAMVKPRAARDGSETE